MEYPLENLELLVTEERLDYNSLHGLANKRIMWDRASGVPEAGRAYMIYQWLLDLVIYDVVDADVVHNVQLTLEEDGEISRSLAPETAAKLICALDRAGA